MSECPLQLKKTSEQTKSLQAKFDIGIQSEFLYIQIYMSIPHEFYKFWCLLLRACQSESVLHLHFLFALLAMNSFQKHGFFHILKNTLALMVVQVFWVIVNLCPLRTQNCRAPEETEQWHSLNLLYLNSCSFQVKQLFNSSCWTENVILLLNKKENTYKESLLLFPSAPFPCTPLYVQKTPRKTLWLSIEQSQITQLNSREIL